MPRLFISEYASMAPTPGLIGQEPCINQTVEIGPTSAMSEVFNPGTRFVRVHADAECWICFGTNPVATTMATHLAANAVEWFGVLRDHRLSVISAMKSDSTMSTEASIYDLLQVIADPDKAKARLDQLKRAEERAVQSIADAELAHDHLVKEAKALAERESNLTVAEIAVEDARNQLDERAASLHSQLANAGTELRERQQLHTEQAKALADSIAAHEIKMAEFIASSDARTGELDARHSALDQRDKELAVREKTLVAAEKKYANRMARLKELSE